MNEKYERKYVSLSKDYNLQDENYLRLFDVLNNDIFTF